MVVRWEPGSPPRWARLCDFGCVTCLPLGPQFLVCKVLGVCIGGWDARTGGFLRFLLPLRVYSQLFIERFFLNFFGFSYTCAYSKQANPASLFLLLCNTSYLKTSSSHFPRLLKVKKVILFNPTL